MTQMHKALAGLIALAGMSHFAPARADIGTETAELLNLLYADTRQDCGGPSAPAFLCSGVLLRGTTPSTAYQFYSVSPKNLARGGVSVSYLRKDVKFRQLAYGYKSGFIFDTAQDNPAGSVDHKVLCAFPVDAASDDRSRNGCGDSSRTAGKEDFCGAMGITTAEQWLKRYRNAAGPSHSWQCGFNVQGANAAAAFYQTIRAGKLLGAEAFAENNELILAPWKMDVPRSPSILASFYTGDGGVEGARLSQIQWYTASGFTQVLPAIAMKLPQTQQEDARFVYEPLKQAIVPVTESNACTSYIKSATWVTYKDTRYAAGIPSVQVVPSDCGRRIADAQIPNFVNALVAAHYLTPQWGGNAATRQDSIEVVRRQLTCHLKLGRNLALWSIEPARPLASQQDTIRRGCNN